MLRKIEQFAQGYLDALWVALTRVLHPYHIWNVFAVLGRHFLLLWTYARVYDVCQSYTHMYMAQASTDALRSGCAPTLQ